MPVDGTCTSGRGQVLIPWPNRIEDGRYDFDGASHSLPLDEVPNRNAIHGLVRWAAWTAAEHEPHRVVMAHVVHPQPGYPFSLSLAIEYSLSDAWPDACARPRPTPAIATARTAAARIPT